jgi:alkylation response protein AidB-like acyl-CoA dehydrogenase
MKIPARRADTLHHDVWLPPETRRVRQEVREFAEAVLRPVAHRLNNTPESVDSFPHEVFRQMADAGLYRIPFAADVGGRGLEFPTLATMVTLEELAYFSPGLTSALYDGQAILVGKTLKRAQEPLRSRYLSALVRGEFVGSFATSEPEASTDLSAAAMQTVAVPVEGGFSLTGGKRWITNSVVARYILVLARTEARLSMFLVDMHSPGITVGKPDLKMGNHAQLTADVRFEQVFVPADHVVGIPGNGLKVALGALAMGRMGIGAIGVAMAQSAFDFAAAYISERKVFGKPIAAFQHWQFTFAEHAINLENARNLYLKAAYRFDTEGESEVEGAMAKFYGSRLAVDVARDAIQACGAYGFVRELSATSQTYPLESIYRDAKIGEIYEGTNEIQRWIIARHIFGRDLAG